MTSESDHQVPSGVGLYSVTGDKDECDTCSFLPVCHLGERGWDCIVTKTKSTEVAIAVDFAGVGSIETALGQVLQLQAQRIQEQMNEGPGAEATAKQQADHRKDLDKNINNLFKNGLALRNAKAAAAAKSGGSTNPGVLLDDDGNEIPTRVTPELMAWALDDLEKSGLNRRSVTRTDVVEHLREHRKLAPASTLELEGEF